jgi:hypothetical protein
MSKFVKGLTGAALIASAGLFLTASAQADADGAKLAPKSVGQLAFAPNGVLLVGDTAGAAIFAFDTGDTKAGGPGKVEIPDLNTKIAALLGTTVDQVTLQDVAVNPKSGSVYLSVERGSGPSAQPVILRADRSGGLKQVDLSKLKSSYVKLMDAPTVDAQKAQTITDVGYVDGKVIVAGLSNEEFTSGLRAFDYPFKASAEASQIEMFHTNHNRFETNAPVRTFIGWTVDGQPSLLAAYTCTPIVKIPLSDLKPGAKVRATTIAEMGNLNRPIDMIAYKQDGKDYFLMANSARGMMKVDADQLVHGPALTKVVSGVMVGKPGEVPYRTLSDMHDVTQLSKVDDKSAVIVVATAKTSALQTIAMP